MFRGTMGPYPGNVYSGHWVLNLGLSQMALGLASCDWWIECIYCPLNFPGFEGGNHSQRCNKNIHLPICENQQEV